jgi:hypothetical protein
MILLLCIKPLLLILILITFFNNLLAVDSMGVVDDTFTNGKISKFLTFLLVSGYLYNRY